MIKDRSVSLHLANKLTDSKHNEEREKSRRKEAEIKIKAEGRASSLNLPPCVKGSTWEKSEECVVKPGGVHDEMINLSEKTMQFGLFYATIMYFRARWLLRKRREGEGEGVAKTKSGWDIDTSVPVRSRRSKEIIQATTGTQAGHQRVKVMIAR